MNVSKIHKLFPSTKFVITISKACCAKDFDPAMCTYFFFLLAFLPTLLRSYIQHKNTD